jgi:hypothetical protein
MTFARCTRGSSANKRCSRERQLRPARRPHKALVYAPNAHDPERMNLWLGFACEPKAGDCFLFKQHLLANVCSDNREHFEYLWRWMARAVQEPGAAGEVAVILRGREGVGKGIFAREFGRLFGSHFRHVVHCKHLTGHFNAHLQHCSLLYADEAFFAGDRQHESVLKALVTEETITIEPKGLDAFQVRNCIHLLMSSNSVWVIPAGADARRYFVLDVGDAQIQNSEYFAAVVEQMGTGGREALLHELLQEDLSDFNVRVVPQTEALAEQKAYSRRGVDALVEIIAQDGMLPNVHELYPNRAVTSGEERGRGFYAAARALVPDLKHRSSRMIGQELIKPWGCSFWQGHRLRGIEFPPLQTLRATFDQRHGKQAWSEAEDWSSTAAEGDEGLQ